MASRPDLLSRPLHAFFECPSTPIFIYDIILPLSFFPQLISADAAL
jgi:hypothetical protein